MSKETAQNLEQTINIGKWLVAGFAALVNNIPELTWFLIGLMALDAFFAVGVWTKQRRFPTYEELWSVTGKKAYHLGIILLGGLFDHYVGVPGINFAQATTVFLIGPEAWKILNKAAVLEVPVPPQLAQLLQLFNQEAKK